MLAILKIKDEAFAASVRLLDREEQIKAIAAHPTIRLSVCYQMLGEMGFSSESIIQSRITRQMFVLDFINISADSAGNPTHVAMFGHPHDQYNGDSTPVHIGRLEDFFSTETGTTAMAEDLAEMLDKPV